jgi:hypothetical protein
MWSLRYWLFPHTLATELQNRWCLPSGQFKSIGSANPTIGQVGKLETVEEDRVELVVNDKGHKEELRQAIQELKNVRRIMLG